MFLKYIENWYLSTILNPFTFIHIYKQHLLSKSTVMGKKVNPFLKGVRFTEVLPLQGKLPSYKCRFSLLVISSAITADILYYFCVSFSTCFWVKFQRVFRAIFVKK